jgi:predicted DNA-binding WGR domain protein
MDKIFICKDATSNKFWGYKIKGLTVTCKWGRLGTAGQQKDFKFDAQCELDKYVEDKTDEKIGKGYEEHSPEQLELETVVAQTIGVGNKIEKIAFVQLTEAKRPNGVRKYITVLDPKKDRKILHDPNIQPLVYALISGRRKDKEDDYSAPSREFLLSLNDAKIIKTGSMSSTADFSNDYRECLVVESELPVEINDEAQEMSKAVGACIGKLLL